MAEEEAAPPPPSGPPPLLEVGSDDLFWTAQAHAAMAELGYYAGDDDIEDFFFGESTQSALLTLQVRPLAEMAWRTGCWRRLGV